MLNPRGILFDLDGTLVDTSRDITSNINRAFKAMGYPQLSHETILSHVGYGAHYLVQKCLQINSPEIKVDDKLVTQIWEKFREFYRVHIIDEAQPYPGVVDFLRNEKRPMGVISNKPEEMVKAVLRELHLDQHFKFCWGRDTLPVSKPDPEVIRYGIHELGIDLPADVCMLGDNPVDTIAAKGAGAISIALSYGFSSVEMLEKEQPDFLFHNFEEFVRTIQSS
ncbi:MAG: HAD-IA family hydrolase [Candidatus Marinimicrobia bacterium]|jgi:phosphoglycolate phosphatase|nr:HAD-IA family hydrolase [Candidatus Neomarinimicrobiota bacterium]MBT3576146.1 HAD-IA family hydrolase [Candidatus Neomarinimicrobiota bacterium]MBT3678746.1 HAD-IA family hydrolase [Candidatus Neomarinimicrobiota bacterium]MBT3951748.1 HAD-IA family hydrolase [Candidatus Neomarinimicrobiota bacterium]MBT4251713.1 HAD-IA family hydrolase [Candidatus Neomarinimicrobiota bacterium]